MKHTPINWKELAVQVRTIREGGESVSGDDATRALEILIGEGNLRAAVDYYIEGGAGSELARFVLRRIHSPAAMNRCYEIYKSDADVQDRRLAIELLRAVADRRVLSWLDEFLRDEDSHIQMWGIGILDQLTNSGLIDDEEAEPFLLQAENHHNENVRETAAQIREIINRKFS